VHRPERWVKVSTLSADGKEIIFDLLSEGDFFGELSLLDGKPRTATVTTLFPVAGHFGAGLLDGLSGKQPDYGDSFASYLGSPLEGCGHTTGRSAFFDSETRLAKRVMALKDIYGMAVENTAWIELNVSQQHMASLVGITREVLTGI